jgi:hypothetical protein
MALRNQPYLPLYVQDYLTDEKLNNCSWSTQGIYIKILCVLHKQEEYGCILFKQNDKQKESTCSDFASILIRNIPCQKEDMIIALQELIDNGVLFIEGNLLCQKRMINDNSISLKRSNAGKKGGGNPNFVSKFVKTKTQTNPENENEIENDNRNEIVLKKDSKKKTFVKPTLEEIKQYITEHNYSVDPEAFFNFYESKGWVIGKSPMKDWKAAVRTWTKNSQATSRASPESHIFGTQTRNSMKAFQSFNQKMEAISLRQVAEHKQLGAKENVKS